MECEEVEQICRFPVRNEQIEEKDGKAKRRNTWNFEIEGQVHFRAKLI